MVAKTCCPGVAVVLPDPRQDRLRMAHTGVEEGIDLQPLAHLGDEPFAPDFPVVAVLAERGQILQQLDSLVGMAAIVLVAADAIEPSRPRPPLPVVVAADVGERLFERIGPQAEVGVGQGEPRRVHVEAELHLEAARHFAHHVAQRPPVLGLIGLAMDGDCRHEGQKEQ